MPEITPFEWKSTARGRYLGDGYLIQKIGIPILNEGTRRWRSEWIDLSGVIWMSVIISSTGTSTFDGKVEYRGSNSEEAPPNPRTGTSRGTRIIETTNASDYHYSSFDSSETLSKIPKWGLWAISVRSAGHVTIYISCLAVTSQFAAGGGDRN